MAMKKPTHPGELVKDNIEDLGISVAEAAKGLGVTRQHLYNVIGGKTAVTPDMALRLEKALGGGAEMWLKMQSAYDLARARAAGAERSVRRLSKTGKAA